MALTDFAATSVRRLQAFVENTVAYTLGTALNPMMALEEIPPRDRDLMMPMRFRYAMRGREGTVEWRPTFDDGDFQEDNL